MSKIIVGKDGSQWGTIDQYAAFYGVCRRTVYNWLRAGKVHSRRFPSGRLRLLIPERDWRLPPSDV